MRVEYTFCSMNPPADGGACARCAALADIEAIRQLKARYFRLMDSHAWTEFGEVFCRDAVLAGGDQQITGRSAVVAFVSRMSDGVRSAHQGFLPEIEILGSGAARGTWAMSDYYEVRGTDPPVGFTGFGHYHDRYAYEDGAWRIAASRLTRIKIIPLAGGLPAFYRRPGG
jgi:SnoaL-like domain